VILRKLRYRVLHLERLVVEQVERRERLGSKRGIGAAVAGPDHHERKQVDRTSRLVKHRVADDEIVGESAEHRIQLTDARVDVLEHLVVRVQKRQELCPAGPGCSER
jgi:hypothetical protein